eukprot:2096071-Amphidinium_carterae.1
MLGFQLGLEAEGSQKVASTFQAAFALLGDIEQGPQGRALSCVHQNLMTTAERTERSSATPVTHTTNE